MIGESSMDWKAQLAELRQKIDSIDESFLSLFGERMDVVRQVAAIKGKNNLAITDPSREQAVADRAAALVAPELRGEATLLIRMVMALAREQQQSLLFGRSTPLLPPARKPVQEDVLCAYQGLPGAWSEQAVLRLFPEAKRLNVEYFEDVFGAVKRGEAAYGVVAIENSQTGAIGETYDLLRKYGCYIVGRTWIDIRQCLLAPKGVALTDVREVLSHPEGFKQCRSFLQGRAWDLTACRNTAVAANMVAENSGGRMAAIGSRLAAELNGLEVLAPDIMDAADNRTSFVVIATEPEYDEQSNLISVTFSTQHRSGALCESLMPFMAQGLNLMRIESRPSTGDKYRFFAEIEGNILEESTATALRQAAAASDYFEVIGCYATV
jgi:chorismate mutase/prephenate dehydratase